MFRAVTAVFIALTVVFALPATAVPQQRGSGSGGERPKWWQGDQAKTLGLTTDQSNRIEDIHQGAVPRIRAAMQDRDNAQTELDKLISGDRATETDVIRQLIQVQAASNELNRQIVLMLFRQYRELRPDQRVKLKAMVDERREQERHGRGRGEPPVRPAVKK